jgi:predicted phosphodiesterase
MRTFVIADAHGYPELIKNALDHGGFEPGRDAFVFAGDLLDRGPDADGCIALVERHATEVIFGNHDVAALLGLPIDPQNPGSPAFGPFLREKVLADPTIAWKAATCIDGVLITHAGVSSRYG